MDDEEQRLRIKIARNFRAKNIFQKSQRKDHLSVGMCLWNVIRVFVRFGLLVHRSP